jgi:arylsulfatase A-like enzyme
MGVYGYGRPTSPHLDALAADPDAVVYERHYVEGNWTKPSTASLFTGLYVHQHRVRVGHQPADGNKWATHALADAHLTLAERLRDLGFVTFALVKSRHLVREYGFAQGFDTYLGPDEISDDAGRVGGTADFIHTLERPFFGYVHLNACHHPFPESERHPRYMEAFGEDYPEARRIAEGVDFTKPDVKRAIDSGELALAPNDVRFLSTLYDAKLRWVDETAVAPIVAALRQSGRWDRTLLIVTADHGEELYEHRGYAHGHALWNEVIHVPLIVKFPAGRRPADLAKRVTAVTSNVDLYPSIVSFLHHAVPEWLPGRPILERPQPGFAFSQRAGDWAVVQGRNKLYVVDGEPRLFDLAADPGEQHDLAELLPDRVDELTGLGQVVLALEAGAAGGADEIEVTLSEEALENLRALGYIK